MMIAVTAMPLLEIVFEVAGAIRRHCHGMNGFFRQSRAAQIGMYDSAAEIKHRLERGTEFRGHPAPHRRVNRFRKICRGHQGFRIRVRVAPLQSLAQLREFRLGRDLAGLSAIPPDQPGKFGRIEHPVDRRQGSQSLIFRHDLLVLVLAPERNRPWRG